MIVRAMRRGEEFRVAEMVQGLARDTNADVSPRLTGPMLRANADLIGVTVAEEDRALIGACLTLLTFSTWRGAKGLYVVDLFIEASARGRGVGEALLTETVRRGRMMGAEFIKLEVDSRNPGAARFYERLGFACKEEDQLFVLESAMMDRLLNGKEEA